LALPLRGREIGDDWKTEISIITQQLQVKNNEIEFLKESNELLKQRVTDLEKKMNDFQHDATRLFVEQTTDDQVTHINFNLNNKTIEERIETLEEKSKLNIRRSCYEYSTYGLTTSGIYQIDPDGELIGSEPINVYCNLTDGSTQLLHDKDFVVEIEPCPEPECYNLAINYAAPDDQIEALKSISDDCYQEISFDCFQAALSSYGDPIGFWQDKMGDKQIYYVGANYNNHICSCGLDDSCSESEHGLVCNCDAAQIPTTQRDSGLITNMTALPIKGFIYGEMAFPSQYAAIQVGRMICNGMKHIEAAHLMDSCSNLKTNGVTKSANYVLNNDEVAFCDMSAPISDPSIQKHIGNLHYTDDDIPDYKFVAIRDDGNYLPTGRISFDKEMVDSQDVFNVNEGKFLAPIDGTYEFQFSGYAHGTDTDVRIYLNGVYKRCFFDGDYDGSSRQISFYHSLKLQQNDEIYLDNYYPSTFYADSDHVMTFEGNIISSG